MPAPPADVAQRLERLASHAPVPVGDPDQLWSRGRRRQGRRWVAALACAVVLAGAGAVGAAPLARLVDPPVADHPDSTWGLPDVVRQPGSWEPAFGQAPGPLVAVGTGTRRGWLASSDALWGVSATTGEARWLDLDHVAAMDAALSQDGTLLAYGVSEGEAGAPDADGRTVTSGLAVRDLVTGRTSLLDLGTRWGLDAGDLVWSGDQLWIWAFPYADADRAGGEGRVWTWQSGRELRAVDAPSRFPLLAAQPFDGGLVLADGSSATRLRIVGQGSARTVRLALDGEVSSPLLSPDGSRVAGVRQDRDTFTGGVPLPIVSGTVADGRAELATVGSVTGDAVLGWRSATDVVVATPVDRDGDEVPDLVDLAEVDVTDGTTSSLARVDGTMPVAFAADAWTAEVVGAPEAPFAPPPWAVGAVAAALALLLLAGWRVTRRLRGHP